LTSHPVLPRYWEGAGDRFKENANAVVVFSLIFLGIATVMMVSAADYNGIRTVVNVATASILQFSLIIARSFFNLYYLDYLILFFFGNSLVSYSLTIALYEDQAGTVQTAICFYYIAMVLFIFFFIISHYGETIDDVIETENRLFPSLLGNVSNSVQSREYETIPNAVVTESPGYDSFPSVEDSAAI